MYQDETKNQSSKKHGWILGVETKPKKNWQNGDAH